MKKVMLCVLTILLMSGLFSRADAFGMHGRFSVVGKIPLPAYGIYYILSPDEILWLDETGYSRIRSSKLYNMKTKTVTDLHTHLNVPREGSEAIRYDDTHILIVGGVCNSPIKAYNICKKVAEIYDIKNNKFTRTSDTHYMYYDYDSNTILLLSDGRVLLEDGGQMEIFDPKTRTFSVVPNQKGKDYVGTTGAGEWIKEIRPNEILLCNISYKQPGDIEVLNLQTNELRPVKVEAEEISGYRLGIPVQVSDDMVLFIGGGPYGRDVYKLDINTLELTNYNRLSKKLRGYPVLLNNNEILFIDGYLSDPVEYFLFWYTPEKLLRHAVYDYKKNKIYKRRVNNPLFAWNTGDVRHIGNAVYIVEVSHGCKLRKYKYKSRKDKS